MLTFAIIIYFVILFISDFRILWPLDLIFRENSGCLDKILGIGWVLLLLAGLGVF